MRGTGTRGTDDAFYHLMLIGGEAVLKLLGVKDPTGYEAKAIVLKGKELRPDILALCQEALAGKPGSGSTSSSRATGAV